MKKLLLLPFLLSIALAAEPQQDADKILSDYYKAVAKEIAADPKSLGMDEVLKRYDDLGKKLLLANKAVLHKKAVADYLALPLMDAKTFDKLDRIAWKESKTFEDGKVVKPGLAKDDMDKIVLFFSESGYGIPPFDKTVFATLWWNPIRAGSTIRELTFRQHLPPDDTERRKFIEQYSPPLLYRTNADGEHPAIAFFDGQEYFVTELKYMDEGIYALTALKWFRVK